MVQLGYKNETATLNAVASDPKCRWWWTKHALEQMARRGISAPDIQTALTFGHVELVERKSDDVWRVRSFDLDGNQLGIACVVFADIIAVRVVTAF